jgi:Fe2+ transport system protein FeoA
MSTLAELTPGTRARIVSVSGADAIATRLMEMAG